MTAEKLFKLAGQISSEEELRRLTDHLEMTDEMEECLAEEWGITETAYMILSSWVKSQPDRASAHSSMCEALDKTNLAKLIIEII